MKYNKELTELLLNCYVHQKLQVEEIAVVLGAELRKTDPSAENPPTRSLIAKLSTLGVYQKKAYLTKRGELPIRKAQYIEKLAKLLNVSAESLESCEKLTKGVLTLLVDSLTPIDPKPNQDCAFGTDLPE